MFTKLQLYNYTHERGSTMKHIVSATFMLFFLTLTFPAMAEEQPTKAQLSELHELIKSGHVTRAELETFLGQNRLGIDSVTTAVTNTFRVEVICDLAVAIKVGKYGQVNSDVTRNSPVPDECTDGRMEVALFHFDHPVSSEYVIREMYRKGYRFATLLELLALGAGHPNLQLKFPLAALGSKWQGSDDYFYVPVLEERDGKRSLHLSWFGYDIPGGGGWRSDCRFVAVRK